MSPSRRRAWDGVAWKGRGGSVSATKPKPTALNTGTSGLLTPHSGNITVTTAGTTLTNLDISGRVIVRAANVQLLNCKVRGDGTMNPLIDCLHANVLNLLIEHCTLRPDVVTTSTDGIKGHDFTARWNNITETTDGFGVFNTYSPSTEADVLIESNYVDDLHVWTPDPSHSDNRTHNDGIQIQGNGGVEVRWNNMPCNPGPTSNLTNVPSSIMLNCGVSQIPNVYIHDNWLGGQTRPINGLAELLTSASSVTIEDNIFYDDGLDYEMAFVNALTTPGIPTGNSVDSTNGNTRLSGGGARIQRV